MAATIMGADRWNAGAALMAAQSPEAWRDLEAAAALLVSNKAALAACRDGGGEGEERTALHPGRAGAVILLCRCLAPAPIQKIR